ncbi:Hint domain-containing protein [Megasphaera paucivorans]|uniref:Hint domain-containing protein n=1 Tax=Megasphaera paucivorans TaxID=349095 RepID=A0A1G9QAG8_9FIRM|nr:Hint domain-containing protein [Megasphaera paucivorans]SDM08006.1 hypothetical protein SAMN05660299_00168 [Megasphaera paucivorans]
MSSKGSSSTTVQSYKPTANEDALTGKELEYTNAVEPNALALNTKAANVLYNSLGDSKVDYNSLLNNALGQINSAQTGVNNLANGQLPSSYQTAMENSIKSGVQNSMGSLLSSLGNKGVLNSSVTDTGLKGISDSAANTMAQEYNNNINTLSNLYSQQVSNAQQPITTAASAQEAAQEPALNLWNASLGLNGATTGALSALSGKGTTTSSANTSGGSGLFGGILAGLANNSGLFCFPGDTKIKTPNGNVRMDSLKVGDKVICPHTDGTESTETITGLMPATYNDVYNVITDDGKSKHYVSATSTQPFLAADGNFVELGKISIGLALKGVGKVISIIYSGERKVYDMALTGANNYCADGFIAQGGSNAIWGGNNNA